MADRYTTSDSDNIRDGSISKDELNLTNTPTDGQIVKINMPAGDFTAIDQPSGGGGTSVLNFVIDGGGISITTGIKGDVEIPFGATINQVTLLADQTGSIVIDIWKDTYANFPPTNADSITASATPTISSSNKSQDSTLTGWTTSITAGDILRFNVDSVTDITRVTLSLKITKT